MEFFQSKERFPAMVSAWGTGKTMVAILKAMDLSIRYPGNQGLILRKNFTDLKDSTMSDFEKYTGIKVKVQSKSVELPNGSKILFHHADELAGVVQNINLGWFFIEQAEEFDSEEVFQKLRGRLRRADCQRQGIIIANTNGHNWVWRLWKQKPTDGFHLIEAKTEDNAINLPADFIEDLKAMGEQSPSHYRRFVLNSWEDVDTADKVIPYDKILSAVDRDLRDYAGDAIVISCDPAEFGDDKTVIYVFKGLKVIDSLILAKKPLMETAGHIMAMYHKYGAQSIGIDDIGVGAGVRSRLVELKAPVVGINTGRKANNEVRFNRLKDEIWMHASELFKDEYVSIPKDDMLIEELAAQNYSMTSNGKVQLARKIDVKKELGHSPDRADALVIGLWIAKKTHKPITRPLQTAGNQSTYNPLTYGLD